MTEIKRLNLVLDIDQTLVHTHGDIDNFDMLNIYKKPKRVKLRKKVYSIKLYDVSVEDGTGDEMYLAGIFRPYLKEFLDFAMEHFNVIIWSAGRMKYVHKMVDKMFPIGSKRPHMIYTYDDCDIGKEDYLKKPLKKLYHDPELEHLKMNDRNTLVVDDRDDTFSLNRRNGIQIPEFESDMTAEEIDFHPDIALLQLMAWMKRPEVLESDDVRNLNKRNIFKTSLKEYAKELSSSRKSEKTKSSKQPQKEEKPE